jgi:L-iditol 2-dehydrogenase
VRKISSGKVKRPIIYQTPAALGHEVAGIVEATGPGVTTCREGDAIVVANSAPCLACFYCRRGRYSLCEDLLLLRKQGVKYALIPPAFERSLLRAAPGQ